MFMLDFCLNLISNRIQDIILNSGVREWLEMVGFQCTCSTYVLLCYDRGIDWYIFVY